MKHLNKKRCFFIFQWVSAFVKKKIAYFLLILVSFSKIIQIKPKQLEGNL